MKLKQAPDFKLCSDCPSPKACSKAGKCLGKKNDSKNKNAYYAKTDRKKNKNVYYAKTDRKKKGYAKGGMVNCGASMKPGQKRTK